jgi:Rhs element Vgr protein
VTGTDPATNTGLQLNAEVSVNGETLDSTAIVSIESWSGANKIPRARITIYDGTPATADFPLSDSDKLVPGATVTLSAGYGSDSATIHSGVIVRHSLRILPGQSPQLIIETADPLLKMTVARNSAVSEHMSDADLIAALVANSGGSVGKNAAATEPAEAIVQYYASDWDLMLLRAEASGCVVLLDNCTVDIADPSDAGDPVLTAEYGTSIISFEATVDAETDIAEGAVASRSWSYADQAVKSDTGSTSFTPPGNLSPATLAGVLGVAAIPLQSSAAMEDAALKRWAAARLLRSRLAQVRGTARFQGNAAVKPGKTIALAGLGDRFNGTAFVSAVRHVIKGGRWITVAEFGMAPEGFASQRRDVAAPPAAGLSPPMRGLHVGQVKQVATDPNGDFRVQVTMPLVSPDNAVWARLGQFYASNGFGAVFFPEVGDEVVLGFMDEDVAGPVILASLYSRGRAPKFALEEANDTKAIVTRQGLQISFDEQNTVLKIETPGGRVITLDDQKDKMVKIEDPYSNAITMTQQQVEIVSGKDMKLTVGGDLTITATGSISASAGGDFAVKGQQVSVTGAAGLALKSNTVGSLKAAAELTVNAPLVKIN